MACSEPDGAGRGGVRRGAEGLARERFEMKRN